MGPGAAAPASARHPAAPDLAVRGRVEGLHAILVRQEAAQVDVGVGEEAVEDVCRARGRAWRIGDGQIGGPAARQRAAAAVKPGTRASIRTKGCLLPLNDAPATNGPVKQGLRPRQLTHAAVAAANHLVRARDASSPQRVVCRVQQVGRLAGRHGRLHAWQVGGVVCGAGCSGQSARAKSSSTRPPVYIDWTAGPSACSCALWTHKTANSGNALCYRPRALW